MNAPMVLPAMSLQSSWSMKCDSRRRFNADTLLVLGSAPSWSETWHEAVWSTVGGVLKVEVL